MDLDEIKTKVAGMSEDQQDHLVAYLIHLRHQRDAVAITQAIPPGNGDKDTTNWISLDQLKDRWKD